MPPADLAALLQQLWDAFPRESEKLPQSTVRVYLANLSDLPLPSVAGAVSEMIRTAEFFPKVSQIRAAAAERLIDLPSEDAALEQIDARMRWAREGEDTRPAVPPPVHVEVRAALDLVGGYQALRAAERPEVVRGQFARIYREARARAIRHHQVGADVLALPAGTRKELAP